MSDEEWVMYKRADGEMIYGEYDFVSELRYFDEETEPRELIKETWQLVSRETITYPERETAGDPLSPLCRRCGGNGRIRDRSHPLDDDQGPFVWIGCPACNGSGRSPGGAS